MMMMMDGWMMMMMMMTKLNLNNHIQMGKVIRR